MIFQVNYANYEFLYFILLLYMYEGELKQKI